MISYKIACASNGDSVQHSRYQHAQCHRLISLRCCRTTVWVLGYPQDALRSDMSLRSVHMQSCSKCCGPANYRMQSTNRKGSAHTTLVSTVVCIKLSQGFEDIFDMYHPQYNARHNCLDKTVSLVTILQWKVNLVHMHTLSIERQISVFANGFSIRLHSCVFH